MPAVERFSIEQVDKTLDPCTDFFQYACSKWLKANPIPPDQGSWGTFNALAIWNVAAVRNTLEEAAKPSPTRTAVQQKWAITTLPAWMRTRSTRPASNPYNPRWTELPG